MKIPELLAPAGSFEKAKTAFLYGADAVYMGTSKLSLRSRVNTSDDELIKTIEYAHSINKKVQPNTCTFVFVWTFSYAIQPRAPNANATTKRIRITCNGDIFLYLIR